MSATWHLCSIETAEPETYRASLTREGEHWTFTELVTCESPTYPNSPSRGGPESEPLPVAILAFHKPGSCSPRADRSQEAAIWAATASDDEFAAIAGSAPKRP